MIGDPFADLATMRMRDSYEPTGDSIAHLIRHYEAVTGEAVDRKVVSYHTALFSANSAMQIGMAVADPQPGDPHSGYIEWTLGLRTEETRVGKVWVRTCRYWWSPEH